MDDDARRTRETHLDRAFSAQLAAARRGDRNAADWLYSRHATPVRGAIRRMLRPGMRRRYETLDLSQSVFADVLRELPRFEDRGEEAFRHWLYIRARSKILGKLRKLRLTDGSKREVPLDDHSGLRLRAPSPWEVASSREARDRVRDLLHDLPVDGRELVRLRNDEGLPFSEIAERLGLPSAGAARKRYARCLLHLKENWNGA